MCIHNHTFTEENKEDKNKMSQFFQLREMECIKQQKKIMLSTLKCVSYNIGDDLSLIFLSDRLLSKSTKLSVKVNL